jgi:hypothetical protein
MNGWTRAGATLIGAAAAGVVLWLAAQLGRHSNGSYWAAYVLVAAAGLVFAISQWRGRTGHPPGMLGLGFLPVLIVGGWVLLAMQPHGNWFRSHVLTWSGDAHIGSVVRDIGTWLGVLAFGIGYTLGAALEPAPRRVAEAVVPPTYDRRAADEPVAAERRELANDLPVRTAPSTSTTTSTAER